MVVDMHCLRLPAGAAIETDEEDGPDQVKTWTGLQVKGERSIKEIFSFSPEDYESS